MAISGTASHHQNESVLVTDLTASGDVSVGDDLTVTGDLTVATKQAPATATIALAASTTTDGMKITVTMKDAGGSTLAGVYILDLWMSEAATGIGLTGDTYSGDLTASTGTILGALTAKKAWRIQTAASGIFEAVLVASANPTDQYAAVSLPLTGNVIVSSASGTNWEGAT